MMRPEFDSGTARGLSPTTLATLAVAAQVILVASAWLLPFVSEFSLTDDSISELALGRFGFIQTTAFFVAGLGTVALAVGLRQATRGVWGSRLGSALLGLYGLGAILEAIFPTDKVDGPVDVNSLTTVGLIHVAVALVAFLSMVVGMFVLSWTFKRDARWRAIWPWSLALACGGLVAMVLPSVGLYQRLLVGTAPAWIVLVALRLRWLDAHQQGASASPRRSPNQLTSV